MECKEFVKAFPCFSFLKFFADLLSEFLALVDSYCFFLLNKIWKIWKNFIQLKKCNIINISAVFDFSSLVAVTGILCQAYNTETGLKSD